MPGKEAHFNSPDSVLSQINGAGNTNPSIDGASRQDPVAESNNATLQGESEMQKGDSQYKSTRADNYQDPATAANKEMGPIKNPDPVQPPQTTDIESNVEMTAEPGKDGGEWKTTQKVTQTEHDRKSTPREGSEQGWLERQAMKRINNKMADATSNVGDSNSTDAKDPDTSTKPSKKGNMGKVPAIDQTRPKPADTKPNRPKPTYPLTKQGPKPSYPKLKAPKLSVPKMKLR